MRRIARNPYDLAMQLSMAARGISLEPAWPATAPSQAAVEAASAAITSRRETVGALVQDLRRARHDLRQTMEEGTGMLREVDRTTSILYGEAGAKKHLYGLRPIDQVRNSAGPTPQVVQLVLGDGPLPGSLRAKWKSVARATYEVQWYSDEALETLMGATVATTNEAIIALPPGTQTWMRVRAIRGKKFGDWSETATRFANV